MLFSQGISVFSNPIEESIAEHLNDAGKEGLELFTWGGANTDKDFINKQRSIGITGIIYDRYLLCAFLVPFLLNMLEGVVGPWCNSLTLQPEQSGGVGSSPGKAPLLERHDKGSRTQLGLLYFCDPPSKNLLSTGDKSKTV